MQNARKVLQLRWRHGRHSNFGLYVGHVSRMYRNIYGLPLGKVGHAVIMYNPSIAIELPSFPDHPAGSEAISLDDLSFIDSFYRLPDRINSPYISLPGGWVSAQNKVSVAIGSFLVP